MASLTVTQTVTAYDRAVHLVRQRVETYARTAWLAQGAYRDRDVDRLVSLIVPRVQAGQVQVANLTSVYIASIDSLHSKGAPGPVKVDTEAVTTRRGVPAEDVYRRPATTTYTALADGASYHEAVDQGISRLMALVGTDIMLALVFQSRESLSRSRFKMYRRVLTGRENCALCTIASTQAYHRGDLLPIHPGCDCRVQPIRSDEPIPQVIDHERLEGTHNLVRDFAGTEARDGREVDYRQLIVTEHHGEYGPTIAWRAHKFTGPDGLAK